MGKGLKLLFAPCIVHKNDVEIVAISHVAQFTGKVDVSRDEDNGGWREEVVGKLPHGCSELVICGVFGHRTHVNHSHL